MGNTTARQQALEAFAEFRVEPTSLVSYQSRGKLLALGSADELSRCDRLPQSVEVERIEAEPGRVDVQGYLGAYVVEVDAGSGQKKTYRGDAILDLGDQPRLLREMLPPGYFHVPQANEADFDVSELEALTGEFQKPRYFDYDPDICAHGVNGKIACSNCIDACPAEAIISIGERIEVDPHLCQGGGSCASVCPSGAIRYLYPNLRDSGMRLRSLLQRYAQSGGEQAIVFFHGENLSTDAYCEAYDNLLPVAVEEIGSVGMDQCLSALAYGASRVVLCSDDETPSSTLDNLRQQIGWVRELLIALGLDPNAIELCRNEAALPEVDTLRTIAPAEYDTPLNKRSAMFQAVDHLVAQLKPAAEQVDLPSPAPFGDVVIDAGKCTLCMACVGACPGKALQDGSNREVPEVFFFENNCLQCGACVQTCPEDAIELVPRLVLERESRNRGRALNRDMPFACIACGKPFASTSVIDKMLDKLKDHHMFGSERALNRLKMCEDCRVVDIVEDPEAMGGQFDPRTRFR